MNDVVLFSGAVYGALAVIFGAFGAHALKKIFTQDQLKNFETGVKYQMYHALLLLFMGTGLDFNTGLENAAAYCVLFGTLLFSFSIYGLCFTSSAGKKWKFLGPITPLGGLLLVTGWVFLLLICLQI